MEQKKQLRKPYFTALLSISCCVLYILFLNYHTSLDAKTVYSQFGAPYAIQIYQGQYWGVFTNSFLHTNLYHLIINLSALWIMGAFIERRIGIFNFVLLGLYASIVTSIAQLTLSDDAGIGLTGVNYFFLAYIFVKSLSDERFNLRAKYMYLAVAIFGILFAYYLNSSKFFNIGIEAMIAGIAYGAFTALTTLSEKKWAPVVFSILILMSSSITLFFSPWSAEWNYFKGYSAPAKGNYKEAKEFYVRAIEIDPGHKTSLENLKYISIDEISDMALEAHKEENYLLARKLYERVLKLDPSNQWAKENMAKLP